MWLNQAATDPVYIQATGYTLLETSCRWTRRPLNQSTVKPMATLFETACDFSLYQATATLWRSNITTRLNADSMRWRQCSILRCSFPLPPHPGSRSPTEPLIFRQEARLSKSVTEHPAWRNAQCVYVKERIIRHTVVVVVRILLRVWLKDRMHGITVSYFRGDFHC